MKYKNVISYIDIFKLKFKKGINKYKNYSLILIIQKQNKQKKADLEIFFLITQVKIITIAMMLQMD
jgi:hypothetical protein